MAPNLPLHEADPGPRPLAVSPKRAGVMLDNGLTRVYELVGAGELESYLDGRSRKITVASIVAYIGRRIEDARRGPPAASPTRIAIAAAQAAAQAARKKRSTSLAYSASEPEADATGPQVRP